MRLAERVYLVGSGAADFALTDRYDSLSPRSGFSGISSASGLSLQKLPDDVTLLSVELTAEISLRAV